MTGYAPAYCTKFCDDANGCACAAARAADNYETPPGATQYITINGATVPYTPPPVDEETERLVEQGMVVVRRLLEENT